MAVQRRLVQQDVATGIPVLWVVLVSDLDQSECGEFAVRGRHRGFIEDAGELFASSALDRVPQTLTLRLFGPSLERLAFLIAVLCEFRFQGGLFSPFQEDWPLLLPVGVHLGEFIGVLERLDQRLAQEVDLGAFRGHLLLGLAHLFLHGGLLLPPGRAVVHPFRQELPDLFGLSVRDAEPGDFVLATIRLVGEIRRRRGRCYGRIGCWGSNRCHGGAQRGLGRDRLPCEASGNVSGLGDRLGSGFGLGRWLFTNGRLVRNGGRSPFGLVRLIVRPIRHGERVGRVSFCHTR